MAEPAILFNTSTGSDSLSSGAGPTASINGTSAAHTNGSSTTTITLTNSPDLSQIAVDGSACIWLKTASGRQFSKITGVDNINKTITAEDAFNITSGSAVNYAIGGKRATWEDSDSRTLFGSNGAKTNWQIITETDQSINSSIVCSGTTSSIIRIKGDSFTNKRTITQTQNTSHFSQGSVQSFPIFENLIFINSNATKTASYVIWCSDTGPRFTAKNCIFGSYTSANRILSAFFKNGLTFYGISFVGCDIINCVGSGCTYASGNGGVSANYCYIANNGGYGLMTGTEGAGSISVFGSIIVLNSSTGLWGKSSCSISATNCVIHGNGGDGINCVGGGSEGSVWAFSCQITGNANYGIRGGVSSAAIINSNLQANNYGSGSTANTSGDVYGVNKGSYDRNVNPNYIDINNSNYGIGNNELEYGWVTSSLKIGAGTANTINYSAAGAAQPMRINKTNIPYGSLLINTYNY